MKEAENTRYSIEKLRNSLNLRGEFKFNKTNDEIKNAFFSTVIKHNFQIQALVILKDKIYSRHLKNNNKDFYRYCVKLLIEHDGGIITPQCSIKIDGRSSKAFRGEFLKYLKSNLTRNKFKKLRFVDSTTDNLIQLADMVVGAIARSYNHNRKDNNRWRLLLRSKIDNVLDFK